MQEQVIHKSETIGQQDMTLTTQDQPIMKDEELQKNNTPTICIVDDSPDILNLLSDILDYHGYHILSFTSGETALKSITVDVPDLILLDVKMPVMDGYDVCKHLKADENTRKVPVIFISGLDDATDKVKGFNIGGVDYITKPFQLAEVIARVETHLSVCSLQRELEGKNIKLEKEIAERELAEEELRRHKLHLEELVAERTAELRNTNDELQREIVERQNLEEALENANFKLHSLVYEYGVRNQRISLFNQMSERLQTCLSLEETYPIVNHFVQKLFPDTAGAIFIFNHRENFFEAKTVWGKMMLGEKVFNADDCLSLQEKKMHISVASHEESCCRHLTCAGGKSSLCIPLSAHGDIIGILHLQQKTSTKSTRINPEYEEQPVGINVDTQQLAITMADLFALALVNIKLRETLKQQATRDPLTGLFNRRYLEETLNREISRADRHETPLGIIMVDLDHFRRFNNTFGHDAGDLVLQDLGKFLQNNIRTEDIACRYGGEEFTLILPGASLEITRKRAETLRHGVQHLQISYDGKLLDSITLSLGVAIFPDHGPTGEAVLQAADMALYSAKHAGRNRVEMANNTKPSKMEEVYSFGS
ncbi:MAG: diguanylate cyclase [Syntrophaceae bacterium]